MRLLQLRQQSLSVMVGLGPTIHQFACRISDVVEKLVDAWAKPWHDGIHIG
ncbi:MAG TPA: hypothetical protein VG742_14010 [Dongiaceae bacterium]|nr:hypothetical protein [Dongiaceae bacterium]